MHDYVRYWRNKLSRTFRRKNIEYKQSIHPSHDNPNVAGYYTEYDIVKDLQSGHGWRIIHRPPTREELFDKFKIYHLDAGTIRCYYNNLDKYERKLINKINRSRTRKEVTRFVKGIVEDIVICDLGKFPKCFW